MKRISIFVWGIQGISESDLISYIKTVGLNPEDFILVVGGTDLLLCITDNVSPEDLPMKMLREYIRITMK